MRDVIVIGGGPAGSTAATLLAQRGHSVTLLERERFPRFQIGESLLPYNNDLFSRLGVSEQLGAAAFVPKFGAHFVTGDGSVAYSFRFDRRLQDPYRRSFQVKRADFDHLLLRNAAGHGVMVREGEAVASVDLSSPDRVVVRTASGEEHTARFLVDASGHSALVGSKRGQRAEVQSLKKVAIFAHYRGVPRPDGRDGGSTSIVILRDAWFWLIPVSNELMSVGLVVDRDHFLATGLKPEEILERTIAVTPWVAERMQNATRETQVYTRKDFSFRVRNITGPNYALIGDAAGFLDPIFSTGVFIAMKSADLAAEGVSAVLSGRGGAALARYERDMQRSLDGYLRFIEKFYDREFLEVFLQPTDRWGLLDAVVRVLAGDVFGTRSNRFRLALFFFLVRLQRWRGVVAPRIAWESVPAAASLIATLDR